MPLYGIPTNRAEKKKLTGYKNVVKMIKKTKRYNDKI